MDPINYNIDIQTPFQAALSGYQGGVAIRADQLQQQQQQLAIQQQQAQQQAMQRLMANPNPTADDFSNATLAVPGMKDQFKQAWEMRNTQQQQSDLSHAGQVYASLQAGQPTIAAKLLTDRAAALRNSGNEADARNAETMAGVVEAHPDFAKSIIGMKLAAVPGGEKVITGAASLGAEGRAAALAPSVLSKSQADASTATSDATIKGAQAAVAPTTTALGNEKTAQEIAKSKVDADVAQFNAQIASANSETERGKLTLERDKYIQEQAKLNQAQGVSAQDGMDSLNNAMQSVNDIKNHRGMDAFFTGPGTKWGAIWRAVPGSDRQALETYIDTLKSQLGYGSLMAAKASSPTGASGFGALSESELKVISQQAADLNPNSADFPLQLSKVERFLQKAQAKGVAAPNLPLKGGAYVSTVPGIGVVDEGHINQLLKANPGATRAQVIQFLQSAGGK